MVYSCVSYKELQRQKLALAEKLKKNREEKMKRLEKEQEKERENFVRKADKIQDTSDLVEVRKEKLCRNCNLYTSLAEARRCSE